MMNYIRQYMPIKFGSALYSKLQKKYWNKPNISGRPIVFAIEDFSSPASMVMTRSALDVYLYGFDHDWIHDEAGNLEVTPRKISEHRWGSKIIPSGFFDQPEAENISAVLFSNSGTISKFNRMGLLAEFGSGRVVMIRKGTAVNHDPNAATPMQFAHVVNAPGYCERWVEGLELFHNPRAIHPIDGHAFPGAAQHRLLPDGQRESLTPDWHPLGSITMHYSPVDVESTIAKLEVQIRKEM